LYGRQQEETAMRYVATILVLVPGVFSLVSDPDALGIGFFVLLVVPLYLAWRTKIIGGALLIAVGALTLAFLLRNLLSTVGISGGVLGILQWVAFAILPAAAGMLFILAGKKKQARAQTL
jgi:hypothetical protein